MSLEPTPRIALPARQRRRLLLAAATAPLLLLARPAYAFGGSPPQEVVEHLAQARLQGSGRLRFFGLHVYDARLWVGAGFRADAYDRSALALELEYARSFDGSAIAERSLVEMKNLAPIDDGRALAWRDELARILPDVKPGDRITGIALPGDSTRFYLNGKPIGALRDAQFTRLFFGIWLSPRTSEPGLRSSLIGRS
ncbi:chalcone isomerase family protein [Piscinibacter sakaiensis]|uniref:chalcone isomerase family protein n=1 Tax=Piscinibacter sakaiensis TaxID=1547922 RepID=UPI003AAD3FCD